MILRFRRRKSDRQKRFTELISYLIMLVFCLVQLKTYIYTINNPIIDIIARNTDMIYIASTFISLYYCLICYLRRGVINLTIAFMVLFHVYIAAVSVFSIGFTEYRTSVRCITFILLLDTFINEEKYGYIKALSLAVNTLILINVFNIIVRKTALSTLVPWVYYGSEVYFLGLDNGFITYILPALVLGAICYKLHGSFILHVLPCFIAICAVSYLFVLTSLMCMLVGGIMFAVFKRRRIYPAVAVFFNIIPFLIFEVFRAASVISALLLGNSEKIQSFFARTAIWDRAIPHILSSPIFGNGFSLTRNSAWLGVGGCHNQILDLMIQGGLIGTILYFIVLFNSARCIEKAKDNYAYLIYCLLCGLGLCMNFESYSSYTGYALMFAVFVIAVNYKKICQYVNKEGRDHETYGSCL